MRAIVLDRPGSFRVAQVPDPVPGPGQIVVKVDCCGICGTDLHIVDGEFPPTPYPITPGHEFAGTVVATGAGVATAGGPATPVLGSPVVGSLTGAGGPGGPGGAVPGAGPVLPVGTRVAVDPSLFCGYCRRCRSGRDNLCENWAATGDTVNGAFAEYVAVPAANAYPLPDHLDGQQGAMVEPLACAVHGLRRLGPVLGEQVLLTGAGTMGLLLLQLLVHAGAGAVTVVDRVSDRLEIAKKLGAAEVATSTGILDGERFAVAVDATGVPPVIESAAGLLDRGGRLLVFGVSPAEATIGLSPFRVYNDEITVTGSMAILRSFAPAVDLLAAGAVDVRPLLSDPLPLTDFGTALTKVRTGEGIKWHIRPST